MKRILKFLPILTCLIMIAGCDPDLETADISRVTFYPILTVPGEQWNTIKVGGSFTDPGATAKEGDADLTVTTSGTVDVNTPGVYTITYTAVNKDGYSATDYRYVGVISAAVEGTDMSGSYKRNAGAKGVSTVTKISDNFYFADNVGGVAVTNPSLGVYFYHYDTGLLGVPFQRTPGNAFEATNATVELGVKYSWVVINPGYGAALRTFIKQ
ncbi:MAG: DUF5011 domain-containing protein [Saprospiraceae bacterium]